MSEQFAAQLEAINDEIIALVRGCTDEQWRQPCASEGWSLGVVAHHIAVTQQEFAGMIEALAEGQTRSPAASMEDVHQSNARHARDYAAVGKPETLDLLRASKDAIAHLLRGISEEQLDRTAGVFGGRVLSVRQVVAWIVIGHARIHLASIRDVTGAW